MLDPHEDHCDTPQDFYALCRGLRRESPGLLLGRRSVLGGRWDEPRAGAGGHAGRLRRRSRRGGTGDPRHHFGGMSVDWDLGDADVVERVGELLRVARVDVIAGGPPCQPFSKAGRSGMRYLVREGIREPHDRRRDLWRSFLEIVRLATPRAVIMENVPDMALDREMFILRSMVLDLGVTRLRVQERVVDAWRYGVPQFRQRLILVALSAAVQTSCGRRGPEEGHRSATPSPTFRRSRAAGGPKGGAEGWADVRRPRDRSSSVRCARACSGERRPSVFTTTSRGRSRPDDAAGVRASGREDPLLRTARAAEAVPRRHLRRQVQASGCRRRCRGRSPRTSRRTATGTSTPSRTAP